eukprot:6470868-Amphidinium_carterae.2
MILETDALPRKLSRNSNPVPALFKVFLVAGFGLARKPKTQHTHEGSIPFLSKCKYADLKEHSENHCQALLHSGIVIDTLGHFQFCQEGTERIKYNVSRISVLSFLLDQSKSLKCLSRVGCNRENLCTSCRRSSHSLMLCTCPTNKLVDSRV